MSFADRLKQGSRDVRGFAVPEIKARADEFPEELIAPYEEKMFAYFEQEENLTFEQVEAALSMLLFLRILFPGKKNEVEKLIEQIWERHEEQLLKFGKNGALEDDQSLEQLLSALVLIVPEKYHVLAAAWGIKNKIVALTFKDDFLLFNLDQKEEDMVLKEKLPSLLTYIRKEKTWLDYASGAFIAGVHNKFVLPALRHDFTEELQQKRAEGISSIEREAEEINNPENNVTVYELARKAFALKVLYAENVEWTPEGVRLMEKAEAEESLETIHPQPLAREI